MMMFVSRLLSDGASPWQAKGYLFEGLNGRWPEHAGHHDPGHPSTGMRFEGGEE